MTFDVHCERHGARVLLSARNVFGLADTDNGPVLAWKCHCGQVGLLGRFGDDDTVAEFQPTPAGALGRS